MQIIPKEALARRGIITAIPGMPERSLNIEVS